MGKKDMAMNQINQIAAVAFYWKGNSSGKSDAEHRPGWDDEELGIEYVHRLYRGIMRNCDPTKTTFTLFTNVANISSIHREIVIEPLDVPSWIGCLPKLKAHDPDNWFNQFANNRIVVFDLDTVIVGSLEDIFNYDGRFTTRAWFKGINKGIWLSGGDMLSFRPFQTAWIWERYIQDPQKVIEFSGGRERYVYRQWCTEIDYWQSVVPGQVVSYKNHIQRTGKLPVGARIVSVHGDPRPHTIRQQWIKEHWV